MIDWKKTELETGYGEEYFDKYSGSNKKVYRICKECGEGKWVIFNNYCRYKNISLCNSCSQIDNKKSLGCKHSDESKQKRSKMMLGKNNPMYGKIILEKTRKKLSESGKCRKHTEETKNKMRGENNYFYGKHHTLDHRVIQSCIKQGIEVKDFRGFIGRAPNREHVLDERKCIKLNMRFNNRKRTGYKMDMLFSGYCYHRRYTQEDEVGRMFWIEFWY